MHRCILVGSLSSLLCGVALASSPPVVEFKGTVVNVLEGNRLTVKHAGKYIRVRLHGVDAPEIGQAFGEEATRFAADLALGKAVAVYSRGHDPGGREIAEVMLEDGRVLNRELVRAGLAWREKRPSGDQRLGDPEARARVLKRGMWSQKQAIPPWEFPAEARADRGHRDESKVVLGRQSDESIPGLDAVRGWVAAGRNLYFKGLPVPPFWFSLMLLLAAGTLVIVIAKR